MKLEPGMLIYCPWSFDVEGEFSSGELGMLLDTGGRVHWIRRDLTVWESMITILMFVKEYEKLKKSLTGPDNLVE